MHYSRPALEWRDDEEGHHRLNHIVKIGVVSNPLASVLSALKLVFVSVLVNTAVEEMAFVSVHRENGKHKPNCEDDNDYVDDRSTGV